MSVGSGWVSNDGQSHLQEHKHVSKRNTTVALDTTMREYMRLVTIQIAIFLSLAPAVLKGQLYLIAGTPDSNEYPTSYASDLLQIGSEGVKVVAEILPKVPGTGQIAISYDWRKVVFLSGAPNDDALILAFDEAMVIKRCKIPKAAGTTLIHQWLADVPGRGQVLDVWLASPAGPSHDTVVSMSLNPLVPCNESFANVQPLEVANIVTNGFAGAGDVVSGDGIWGTIDRMGVFTGRVMNTDVAFDFEIPSGFRREPPNNRAYTVINNSQVLVVGLSDNDTWDRALAFRKADKTWHVLPRCCGLREFGSYIAVNEVVKEQLRQAKDAQDSPNQAAGGPPLAESAGRPEWRSKEGRRGPNMAVRFENARNKGTIYPGRLDIYNINTEKLYTITTNQGDSEILLIEDNTVYYRVSNRLYKAPITDSGIGAATLIATDEAIRDAHWAFIKH